VLKSFKYILKTLISLIAVLIILMVLFIWRVSDGPVEIDGSSLLLRNVLIEQVIGKGVYFERSVLTWRMAENGSAGSGILEIDFFNVESRNTENTVPFSIPEVNFQFSSTALFRGIIAPTFIEFSGLELNLLLPRMDLFETSFNQDIFITSMRENFNNFHKSEDLTARYYRQILSAPSNQNSTGYLEYIILRDTKITLTDEISGEIWKIPNATLNVKRIDEGLSLLLEGEISTKYNNNVPLQLSVQYNLEHKKTTTQVRFSNFVPAKIVRKGNSLSHFSSLNVPISGIVNFSMNKNLELPIFDFEFDIGRGLINPANIYNAPIIIDEAKFVGQFITASDEISIEKFNIQLDGAQVNAEGLISSIGINPDIMITADIENFPLVNIQKYWPSNLLKNARIWIENHITDGIINNGVIDVNIRPEMWKLEHLPNDSFVFNFNISQGVSHFLKPMPQLTAFKGRGTLHPNHFLLIVDNAKVQNVDIKNGVLNFIDISKKGRAHAHFELPISGQVDEILKIIDYMPLGYPSRYGVKPDTITGEAKSILTLDFPLIKELKMQEVVFDVTSDVKALSIPALSKKFTISDGFMKLSINRKGLSAVGEIILNGVNFSAQWLEDFTQKNNFPTTYILDGKIQCRDWDKLLLPFGYYVNGTSNMKLKLFGKGVSLKMGEGSFDFIDALVKFKPLNWVKDINNIANTEFNLIFDNDNTIHVNDLKFNSDNMKSELYLTYNGKRISTLNIKSLFMADNDISGYFKWDPAKALYDVSIGGSRFNAEPIMDIIFNPSLNGETPSLPNFKLSGLVDEVSMYNNIVMQQSIINTYFLDNKMIDFKFDGKLGTDKNMSILIEAGDELAALQNLSLNTNDAGQSLRGLDLFTNGDQGDLVVEAEMTRLDKGYSIIGTIDAKNFSVASSKVFNKLLKEKEFSKAQEELAATGLSFSSFHSEFTQYDDVITFKSGNANGPTLGVTLEGYVDNKFNDISIDGTIIPIYELNSLFSNIPLIGPILAGDKGEGVFAATYKMTGTTLNPDVNINPLMVLAPGFFRKIFSAIGGNNRNKFEVREEVRLLE